MAEENEIKKSEMLLQPDLQHEGSIEGQEFASEAEIAKPDFKTLAELEPDLDKIQQVENLGSEEVVEPQKIGRSELGQEKYDVPVASTVELNNEEKAGNLLEMLNGEVPLSGDMHAVMEKIESLSQS